VDRTAGTYSTNSFSYTNAAFPHYITGIANANGTQVAKNLYDGDGRLAGTIDPFGNTTTFIYNTNNNVEVVVDRLNNTNTSVYDLRGNVIATTNALGQVKLMAYDANCNQTNKVAFLGGQPYATNSSFFDPNSLLLVSIDPLGHSNTFSYNQQGQVTLSANALGNTSTNWYDSEGNVTNVCDAQGHTINCTYVNALLALSQDRCGTFAANSYDSAGDLTGTMMYTLSGSVTNILSTNSFSYDANGNQLTSTAWRHIPGDGGWVGATTTHAYDAQNREIQTVEPDGGTNTIIYNMIGQEAMSIDALGHTTSYYYDALGHLTNTTYPDSSTTSSAYDANGNRTNSVDQLGRVTMYVYDALNREIQTIYPDNTTDEMVYDDVGRVQLTIDARGVTNAFGYDAAGHCIAVTNAWGTPATNISFYAFDANGNEIGFSDALGRVTRFVFDSLNHQIQTIYPDGTGVTIGYDANGNPVARTNQDGVVTLRGFDGLCRLCSVTSAVGTAQQTLTQFQYDEAGNLTAQIDGLGHTTTFAYDGMHRRLSRTLPGGQTENRGYDLTGNVLLATNFNGSVITNTYDVMSRLIARSSGANYQIMFGYDTAGNRTGMIDPSGTTIYVYDVRNRLASKTESWNAGPTISLSYAYDGNGNVTKIHSSTTNGVNLAYAYDSANRITNVLAGGTLAAGYGFDPNGNLQSVAFGNGATNLNQYDVLNRLTNSVWKSNALTQASFYYQLGATGNRTNLTETLLTAVTNRTYAWQYDSLYRLTSEGISGMGTNAYGLDKVGNRTNRTAGLGSLPLQNFSYTSNDWLVTDAYDSDGNTLWSTNGVTLTGPYFYDAENRVTNFNNFVYLAYNGDGIRVTKQAGGTNYFYLVDDRNPTAYVQVLEEWTASSGTLALNSVNNFGLALISQQQASTVYYLIPDGHGSTRLLTDGSGSVDNAFTYDAYGNLLTSSASPQTPFLYCGEEFDPDLDLYYLRARYLKASVGRFLTLDEFEGLPDEPLSLHKYLYCHAEPIMGRDPSGQLDLVEIMVVSAELASEFAAEAIEVYGVYNTALTTIEAAQIAMTIAEGGSVSTAQIVALGIQFVPLGKVLKGLGGATQITKVGQSLLKGFYKITANSTKMGELGAVMAARMKRFRSVGYQRPGPGIHGFDDVVMDRAGNYVIIEAKGGIGRLERLARGEQQMSQRWIEDKIEELAESNRDLADKLRIAVRHRRLKGMVVKTKITGPNAFSPQYTIKDWNSIGGMSWQP